MVLGNSGSEGRNPPEADDIFFISETNFLTKLSHKLGKLRLKIFVFFFGGGAKVHCQNGWSHGRIDPPWIRLCVNF